MPTAPPASSAIVPAPNPRPGLVGYGDPVTESDGVMLLVGVDVGDEVPVTLDEAVLLAVGVPVRVGEGVGVFDGTGPGYPAHHG